MMRRPPHEEPDTRGAVYDLFEKYLRFLDDQGWFDPNLLSHSYMARVAPRYDFVVVDEVQDLANVQLLLILRALRDARRFLLCGDSDQIVHPNFFAWSKVKTLFWKERDEGAPADLIRILNANFRNSPPSHRSPIGCCTSSTPASAPCSDPLPPESAAGTRR